MRPFAYNPSGLTISGTINVGDICIGIEAMDYSTNIGGLEWYSGADEINRYIICHSGGIHNTADGGTTNIGFFGTSDKTNESFLDLVNYISGENYTLVSDATTWLSNNNMWSSMGGVTDSLIGHWDATNSSSYPGSGNDLYDLVGSNNGVLSGATYSSDDFGSIDFDGVDDYVELPVITTNISNVTIQCWINVTLNRKGPFVRLGNGSNGYSFGIGAAGGDSYDTNGSNIVALFSGVRWIDTSQLYSSGWQMVTMTLDASSIPSIYINTTLIGSYSGAAPIAPSTNSYFGRCIGDEPTVNRAVDANISKVMIYNKALILSEITQNFNESKDIYGL